MTAREKVIKAVLEVPEEALDGIYELILAQKPASRSISETLSGLAEFGEADNTV